LSLKILCIYVIELVGDALINDYMSFFFVQCLCYFSVLLFL